MQKLKFIILLLVAMVSFCPLLVSAVPQYQEINTSQGKVIVGLDSEKAYQLFGAPNAKAESLWYYAGPPEFFVNFSQKPNVILSPDFYQASVGVPLEFKAFLSLPDSEIRDITDQVQLIFDRPDGARLAAPGVIIPKKPGEFSALAIYNQEVLSNPFNLQVKAPNESKQKEKEKQKLLGIDILPFRPTSTPEGIIDFVAWGTFFDYDLNKYLVRDISQEVAWSKRQRPQSDWKPEQNHRVYFLENGRAEVACSYQGIESFYQRVEVKEQIDTWSRRLKHILVLPETMIVLMHKDIELRALGTYYDNSVMELTPDVEWRIIDPDILELKKNGVFFAKSEGITEVVARKDGVESLAVKVVVNKSSDLQKAGLMISARLPDASVEDTLKKIKNDVDKLKDELAPKKKELKEIKITPMLLEVGLGEKGKFTASGIYDDGSFIDLTILGDWGSLNQNIALVSAGNVTCVSAGETSTYVEFKGVRSEYARVVVGSSRLVSLKLTPTSLRVPRHGQARLKVQGNYYDQTQRDLTEQVSWGAVGPNVVKIEKGVLRPLKFGQSKIYAEYSRLKSNTASVEVILTFGWWFWLFLKIILSLLLGVLCLALLLFLLTQHKKRKLLALKDKPREFILKLHENATSLISIFGLRYNAYSFPLLYAQLAKQKFLVDDNTFLDFTQKFEEAKYSRHVLGPGDVAQALQDYNNFFSSLCKNQNWLLCYSRLSLALLHCRPVFIL